MSTNLCSTRLLSFGEGLFGKNLKTPRNFFQKQGDNNEEANDQSIRFLYKEE